MSLKINSVGKVFNKNTPDEHKGLDNLSFDVSDGEYVIPAILSLTGKILLICRNIKELLLLEGYFKIL
jgi:hypothetical protein